MTFWENWGEILRETILKKKEIERERESGQRRIRFAIFGLGISIVLG